MSTRAVTWSTPGITQTSPGLMIRWNLPSRSSTARSHSLITRGEAARASPATIVAETTQVDTSKKTRSTVASRVNASTTPEMMLRLPRSMLFLLPPGLDEL